MSMDRVSIIFGIVMFIALVGYAITSLYGVKKKYIPPRTGIIQKEPKGKKYHL